MGEICTITNSITRTDLQRIADERFGDIELDLTISDPRWIAQHRLKELVRTREVLCDWFYGENEHQSTDESWKKYFLAFGIAARHAM